MKHLERNRLSLLLLLALLFSACSSTRETADWHDFRNYPLRDVLDEDEGVASYYHNKFHGRLTASGEKYDKRELTAAHRDYPFGSWLRIVSLENGNEVIVRVNDRGPFVKSRLVDVSRAAAEQLDMLHDGLIRVRIEVLAWGEP